MRKRDEGDRLRIGALLVTLLLLAVWLAGSMYRDRASRDGEKKAADQALSADELQVTFFDVGKSDAILIEQAGCRMLIDTSYDEQADVLLRYFAEHGIDTLDYLVITHFDKDHVGGADKILDAMQVKQVLEPDYEVEKKQYGEYREALARNDLTTERVTDVEEEKLGEAVLTIYPPKEPDPEKGDNDMSLVISLRCGSISFLFTGDCERERLSELMERTDLNLSHTVLKVPHHGIKEKNTAAFLKAVHPRAAVICCENARSVSGKVKRTLQKLGAEVYLTCRGTVVCRTDGSHIQISQSL